MALKQVAHAPPPQLTITVDQRSAVPLYEQICQQIRQKIESRQLMPGTSLPTNHQLRDRLRVNYKTAQLAMATLAKEGYVTRQARRGTIVKGVPRRGVVAIYLWIELFGHETKNEYYRLLTGHLGRQLEKHARVHRMYLGSGAADTPNTAYEDLLRHLTGGSLCGALLVNPPPNVQELIGHARTARVPMVSLFGGDVADYSVRVDYVNFVRSAAAHLRESGCKNIGIIYARDSIALSRPGLVPSLLQDSGCTVNPAWIIGADDHEQGGYEAAARMPVSEIDGLIVTDDIMTLGVDRRLVETNVNVPRDLRVATMWNRGSRLRLTLPFDCFEFDVEAQARLSLELVQEVINGQRIVEPHLRVLPTLSKEPCTQQRGSSIPAIVASLEADMTV